MTKVWDYTFSYELRVDPKEHTLVMTESSMNPVANKMEILKIMFEKFEVPAISLQNSALMALYASGRSTGLVVESGHASTYTIPFYEGTAFKNAVYGMNVGGHDVTMTLQKLLAESNYHFTTSFELEIVRNIKETLCFMSKDITSDMKLSESGTELE